MRHLLYLPTISMGLVLSIASPNSGIADTAFLEKAVRDKDSSIEGKLIAWRRDIHQHPELGDQETRTSGSSPITGASASRCGPASPGRAWSAS